MKQNLIETALNLIFPKVCGFCKCLSNSYLCNDCGKKMHSLEKNVIQTYSEKFFETHCWIFEYENEIRDRIVEYKFEDQSYLCNFFCEVILENKIVCDYIELFDYIVPVPLHKKRLKERGYNQSELIAKAISARGLKIEFRNDILKKVKNIKPQSTLNQNERIKNVINAFEVNTNKNINGKKILIFDDVFTTGSTANECAKALYQCGSRNIGICTLAK